LPHSIELKKYFGREGDNRGKKKKKKEKLNLDLGFNLRS
jgi:hypothetical protein